MRQELAPQQQREREAMTQQTRTIRSGLAIVVCAAASLALTGSAHAQGFVSPSIGINVGGDQSDCSSFDECQEKRKNYGISIGYLGGLFGFEQEFVHTPDFFGSSVASTENSVTSIMSNVLVAFPAGPIRPYATVGLGALRTRVDFNLGDTARFKDSKLGWNFGGGVMVLPWQHFGIRADVRQYRGTDDVDIGALELEGSPLTYTRISASALLRF